MAKKRLKYLMFCDKCGLSKEIPLHIVKNVLPLRAVIGLYCDNCEHLNPIPEHLRKITDELTRGDFKIL